MAGTKMLFAAVVAVGTLMGLPGASASMDESREVRSTEQVGHSDGGNVASRHHIRSTGPTVQLAAATSRHHIRGTADDSLDDLTLYRTDSRHHI